MTEDLNSMSGEEIKGLIKEGLEELGVDMDSMDIDIEDDCRLVIRGRASSRRQKELIAQTVSEELGIDEVVNEMIIARGGPEDDIDEDPDDEYDVKDEDDDTVATEDLAQSLEEGIPYIPPSRHLFRAPKARLYRARERENTPARGRKRHSG